MALKTTIEPLVAILRPTSAQEFIGQNHVLAPGKPLWNALHNGVLHSMILWGPPGSGKTTLARLIANSANAKFIQISAVMSGVKDIREAIDKVKHIKKNCVQVLFCL